MDILCTKTLYHKHYVHPFRISIVLCLFKSLTNLGGIEGYLHIVLLNLIQVCCFNNILGNYGFCLHSQETLCMVIAACKPFCLSSKLPWTKKCQWVDSCGGCTECAGKCLLSFLLFTVFKSMTLFYCSFFRYFLNN